MTDETTNLVLEHLRRIRASQERMELDVGEIKGRLSSVEIQIGAIGQQIGVLNQRMDRLEERVGRIERRLDLAEA
jgi:polyhydroxyalkanoate synthesis regulator phasin